MSEYKLPDGRRIHLVRWSMVGTYSGVLEGSKKTASRHFREDIPAQAARLMPHAGPLAVIGPSNEELPDWFCVAHFSSYSAAHTDDPDSGSSLYVCWFIEDTASSLDDVVTSILSKIDWNLAEDHDLF